MEQFSKELDNLCGAAVRGGAVARMERFPADQAASKLIGCLRPAWLASMPPEGTLLYAAPLSVSAADARIEELEDQLKACGKGATAWVQQAGLEAERAEQFRDALSDTLQFLGDMHAMPVDWTIRESQVVYGRIHDLLFPISKKKAKVM